ncbi:hypothetical protein AB1L42_09595 [Thalassoglobus sp. JC818]|uniref:hypothetical protein n=1 Tax=Thalassoglobus sp. JC818 TaxID=3232136 RepID=UPI00345A73FA
MLTTTLLFISLLLTIRHLFILWHVYHRMTVTVLKASVCWLFGANIALLIAIALSFDLGRVSNAVHDQLWYWTAVIMCCPLIAVLGAKRPTSRVWNGFILLPLVAVLGWPALADLSRLPDLPPLVIQSPALVGFGLVLVMGVGNYAGTRCGMSVTFLGVGVMLIVWSTSNLFYDSHETEQLVRSIAACCISFGMLHGFRQLQRTTVDESGFDTVWFDFRDLFGIVWSIRIQEQINRTAEKERWASRLGAIGFEWKEGCDHQERLQTEQLMNHALHWNLRRFVEPDWISSRTKMPPPQALSND